MTRGRPGGDPSDLTRRDLLARNSVLNLAGTVSLALVAIAAIPWLVSELGTARFGLLTLAWALVGTFGVLDLGLGRALTREIAHRLAGPAEDPGPLTSTFLALLGVLGLTFGVVLAVATPTLVKDVLEVPHGLEGEATTAGRLLAATLPLVVVTTGLRGVLEAHQRFELVNALRVPTGILTVAGPLAVAPVSPTLSAAAAVILGSRVLSLVAHTACCVRAVGLVPVSPRAELVAPALRSAGWLTVANMVQPLMVYPDRFIIAATLSASAVGFYAAPHDLATKLVVIPAAPIPVLFPAFATSFAQDRARTARIFTQSLRYMSLFVLPLVLVAVTFAEEGLDLWLGARFASESTLVLQLLLLGVLCQALAQVPFSMLQGAGRADLTAKLLLAELLPYLLALWLAIEAAGIEGAAAVWLARSAIDVALLYVLAARMLDLPAVRLAALAWVAMLLVAAAPVVVPLDAAGRGLLLAVSLAGIASAGWLVVRGGDAASRR